jgi:hypothetical protein
VSWTTCWNVGRFCQSICRVPTTLGPDGTAYVGPGGLLAVHDR